MKGNKVSASIFLVIALLFSSISAYSFMAMQENEVIYEGPSKTEIRMLSDYNPSLKGTSGDTEVYVLTSDEPGGSMLVLGGTHANEPAGFLTALLMIENMKVDAGTMYIIPRANNSAFTHNDPTEGSPSHYNIGSRTFRFGSRATNPIDQWPDPDVYIHASSGQQLSGSETRNLNRAYPGRDNGTLTEGIALGIKNMIVDEDITMTVDLHEASPEYPVINATVAHEESMMLASVAVINMELEGVPMGLEPSPMNLHGLTHRELGDYTDTYPLLMETANPSQGRLKGKTDADLVVEGIDPIYVQAYKADKLFVKFDEKGHPIEDRVGRHLVGLNEFAKALSDMEPENQVRFSNLPDFEEITTNGLEPYLDRDN